MEWKETYEIFPIMVDDSTNLRTVNFYLVKTDQSLVLVDAGIHNEDFMNALHKTLYENGFSVEDIAEIILTHNHYDHVGLVNPITEKHPIPVFAHEEAIPRLKRDRAFMEMRVEFYMKLYKEMGCGEAGDKRVAFLRESIEKNRNQSIHADINPIGSSQLGFEVLHVPGHAPDQIALYNEANQEMIAGDLIIDHISSNALVEPDHSGERLPTLIQHKKSLEKIRNLNLKQIYPGHGVLIKEPKVLIDRRLGGIERKAEKFKNLIREGISTGNGLAKSYYKKIYAKQFSLVMSEIIGHLDYLEANEQIKKEMKNGVWHYSVKE
ncbi:MBL fold metallo-hydrolase [Oceanobacillus salinisoli]|uniref:MBL fold metallo-hydrolase n=1 Tax=Oceanobacillus salinisoli TaxID=2678611 RepID=UPI0012E261E0|nr:MBL fold metallo-hydrolase [Oceanobacillus salinisoli]